MSLRAEITDALDEVVTPAPMLERTVSAYLLADDRERKVLKIRPRRSHWNVRRLTVAAAVLVVLALVGGLILSGRLLRDLHNSPSPAINQKELKKLEARPLVSLQSMLPDGECPTGPVGTDFMGGIATGDGLMRTFLGFGSSTYHSSWGTWTETWFLVNPQATGLFLVRARDLRSGGVAYFAGNLTGVATTQFGHAILAGTVAGHDQVNGQDAVRHSELVINASGPSDYFTTPTKPPLWGAYVGYPKAAAGCIQFQVDHDGSAPETYVYGY